MGKNTLASALLGAAVALAAPGSAGAGSPGVSVSAGPGSSAGTGAQAPAPAVSSGTLSCSQLEALWESAGGSAGTAFTAAEIARAESSGRQYASLTDSNGTTDEGYWQINTSHGSLATYDPYGNARAAVIISSDGTNWSPWVTYQTGAYAGQC
jgi:hypothetical protein